MKHRLIVSVVITVLIVLSVSQLYAQDEELTLESLAAQVTALTERVTDMFTAQADLTHRLAIVETAIAPTPTPVATATPTPDPTIPRLQYNDIEKDDDANTFAARRKYREYEGTVVEVEGKIHAIGNNWDGRGIPYIQIGWVPKVHCNLEEVEEDVLYEIREDDNVLIKGKFTIWDEIDSSLFIIMEDCLILLEEETDPIQE